MDINRRISHRINQLRDAQGLSLATLSERSGVSRSTISLIERGECSPTATVLDKLATALGVVLAALFSAEADSAPPVPLARPADQPVWRDPASGYQRRALSPLQRSPLQLVEVSFPGGESVTYETGSRDADIHQQVWMLAGRMRVSMGDDSWDLAAGDCLGMRLNRPTSFHNPGRDAARYLVAVVSLPYTAGTADR